MNSRTPRPGFMSGSHAHALWDAENEAREDERSAGKRHIDASPTSESQQSKTLQVQTTLHAPQIFMQPELFQFLKQ